MGMLILFLLMQCIHGFDFASVLVPKAATMGESIVKRGFTLFDLLNDSQESLVFWFDEIDH